MVIKTSGGEEIPVATIIINGKPKSISLRIENMSMREAISLLSGEDVIPFQEYAEFTEIESIRKGLRGDVTITLKKAEQEETMPIGIPEQVEEE